MMIETEFLDSSHKVTIRLGWATVIACLSTFQFGYHLAELNGPSNIISCNYHNEGQLGTFESTVWYKYGFNECIPMDDKGIAIITTMFTLGGLAASILIGCSKLSNNVGRRAMCFFNSLTYLFGSTMMTFTNKFWLFNIGRFVAGLAAGSSLVVSPILINELTPTNHRGLLGSLLQVAVAIGVLTAQIVSYFFSNVEQWRYVFLVAASISMLQFLTLFTTVESPKWLILNKGDVGNATYILHGLRSNKETVHHEINHWRRLSRGGSSASPPDISSDTTALLNSNPLDLMEPLATKISRRGSIDPSHVTIWVFITSREYQRHLAAIVVVMSAQQLVGMNALTFYGVKIMNSVLPPDTNALVVSCSFSLCNVLCVLMISPYVDRLGRRPLLLSSTAITGFCSVLIAYGLNHNLDILVVVSCFGFIIGYSIGLGPLPFLMISELTSHEAVGVAQSIGTTVNWLSTIIVAFLFPILQDALGGSVFYIFVTTCLLYYILTWLNVPETKALANYKEVWNKF